MDTRDTLLEALHADPTDDLAWLALADHLEETGTPDRAELLRLQRSLPAMRASKKRYAVEESIARLLADGVRPCVPTRTNSLDMAFALIPPGAFRMGSPRDEELRMDDEPLHPVRITKPFYLGIHPVTQGAYRTVMGNNPSHFKRPRVKGKRLDPDRFPVEQVSWSEAVEFCDRLADANDELVAGRTYRLPSEAEWEYACRAWRSVKYPFHFGATLIGGQANFRTEDPHPTDLPPSAIASLQRTCEVGRYPPNAFGLYDMHGNVDEWVNDYMDGGYFRGGPKDDPTGPTEGGSRVVRGGSWSAQGADCRAAVRIGYEEDQQNERVGFRVVLVVK